MSYLLICLHDYFIIYFILAICDTLSVLVGASVEVTFEITESVATYACETGYTINGPSSLSCRSDGTWNTSIPSCGKRVFSVVELQYNTSKSIILPELCTPLKGRGCILILIWVPFA